MNNEELQAIRQKLGVGPVSFCRDYLACQYDTGKHFLSGKRNIPDHYERLARMWEILADSGQVPAMKAALGIVTEKPRIKRGKDGDWKKWTTNNDNM